jgi:hypothetical protein
MRLLFALLRTIVALGGLTAVLVTFVVTAGRTPINFFNFFGYFTLQSNILFAIVLLMAAVDGFTRRRQSPLLLLSRGSVASYMIIVGLVYNTLLAGLEGGVTVPWANFVLHVITPLFALIDWLCFDDRPALPWKRLWIVVIYPLLWCFVVLIRGATDGWVPYPFLDPAQGYGVVALFVVAIAVAVVAVAVGIWALSRVRIVKETDAVAAA